MTMADPEDRGDSFTPTEGSAATAEPTTEDKAKVGVTEDDKIVVAGEGEGEGETTGADGKPKKKDTRIPLARHEEMLNKERERREALETELANSRQVQAVAATNADITKSEEKLLTLEEEHTKLMTDGDAPAAAKKMGEIRKLERSIIESRSNLNIQAAEARAYERVRYDTVCERVEDAYPSLNEKHTDFDAEKSAEVVELMQGYLNTGKYTRADALQKAVKVLMPAETTRQVAAVTSDVRVDAAKVAAEQRAAAARNKAADTAGKQPPSLTKVGTDSDKMGGKLDATSVIKMTQDQFAKLDDATLASMRGDELV
jgi:hypothetical protein